MLELIRRDAGLRTGACNHPDRSKERKDRNAGYFRTSDCGLLRIQLSGIASPASGKFLRSILRVRSRADAEDSLLSAVLLLASRIQACTRFHGVAYVTRRESVPRNSRRRPADAGGSRRKFPQDRAET